MKSCEICFKRAADHDGICNVCHGTADDTRARTWRTRKQAELECRPDNEVVIAIEDECVQ